MSRFNLFFGLGVYMTIQLYSFSNQPEMLTNQLDGYVQDLADSKQCNGSVFIAANGRILLNKGYGFANLSH